MSLVQKNSIRYRRHCYFVSIHYMSLVQIFMKKKKQWNIKRFNTLYVVGSIYLGKVSICSLDVFQYIICRWFKKLSIFNLFISTCFNTLYVVGSTSIVCNLCFIVWFQYIICRWFKFLYDSAVCA